MNEFAIEWIKGRDWAGVTVPSHTKLKSKILKLAEQDPDEVQILAENADGSIFAHIPVRYIKISPPRKVSDKQREIARQRAKELWGKPDEPEEEWDEEEAEEMDYDDWRVGYNGNCN